MLFENVRAAFDFDDQALQAGPGGVLATRMWAGIDHSCGALGRGASRAAFRSAATIASTAALVIGAGVLMLIAPEIPATALAQGASPHVLVATTGNDSELRKKVPISRKGGKKPRVVMSMGPEKLPSLSAGDRLKVTAEVQVTTDCEVKLTRCVGRPYTYNPIVKAKLVLADEKLVAGGAGSVELAARRTRCRQKRPDREHHCLIVFTDTILDVASKGQLPCAAGSCHLNMVIQAHNKRKEEGKKGRRNKLLIGEDEPDGSVLGDRGRINVTRFSPQAGQPVIPPLVTNTPLVPSVPIGAGEKVTVYSQQLDGLQNNDQLMMNATMTNDISDLTYNVRIKSRVVLAPSATATAPGKDVRAITDPKGEISEGTGFNCTQRKPRCVTEKVGVISMTKDAVDESGSPIPLFVNVTLEAARLSGAASKSDVLSILPAGDLAVVRYPATLKG